MKLGPDTTAVITGAAGGIGRGVARRLAARGCPLALVDRDPEGLRETAAMIASDERAVSIHVVDVADEDALRALPGEVRAAHGGVRLLINNAGVSLAGPFEATSVEDMRWLIGINLWGTMLGCRYFLPLLRERGGWIVNVASDFGLFGFPSKTLYCASKFGVRGFSEALGAELRGSGVGITCVYPGAVDTGLVSNGRAADPRKRELEAAFLARRDIGVDRVARAITRGVERERFRVLIGADTRAIDLAARFFPSLTNRLVGIARRRIPFV